MILGFICILGILLYYVIGALPESVAQRYDPAYSLKDGAANRSTLWRVVLRNFLDSTVFHKLFGQGSGTIIYFTIGGQVAHNIWLEALIEIGLLGAAVLFAFYFMFFIKALLMKE
jgi:O-antigen ligase